MPINPTFSIVTVCLNAEDTIGQTCESVDAQTYSDYEHLILDGDSTDSTLDIVTSQCNPRRVVVSEPDAGIYDAMNRGIARATGDWVVFLNAGDRLVADQTLELIAQDARTASPSVAVLYGDTVYVELSGLERHTDAAGHENTLVQLPYCHQSMLVRRDVLGCYPFEDHFSIVADYDQMIRLFLDEVGFHRLPFAVAKFSLGGVSYLQETRRHIEAVKMLFDHLGSSSRDEIEDVIWHRLSGKVMRYMRLRNIARESYAIFGSGRYAGRLLNEIRRQGLSEPQCLLSDDIESESKWGIPLVDVHRAPELATIVLGSSVFQNQIIEKLVASYPHFHKTRLVDLET